MTRKLHPDTRLIYQLRFVPVPLHRTYRDNPPPNPNDPTPEQIAEHAAAIRAGWDAGEERRRRGVVKIVRYEIPSCDDAGIGPEIPPTW